jgi:predicted anti-sigma-YlaC factor YlaD
MGAGAVTGAEGCSEIRRALGVYIVGAIDPADRAAVDSHLGRCADCREELAGLAGLPGRLGSVHAADVTRMDAGEADPAGGGGSPDVMLRSLLDRAARLRRHLMWRVVAVAAAVAVIAGGGGVVVSRVLSPAALRPAASALPWAAMVHGSNPGTGAGATVSTCGSRGAWTCRCRSV